MAGADLPLTVVTEQILETNQDEVLHKHKIIIDGTSRPVDAISVGGPYGVVYGSRVPQTTADGQEAVRNRIAEALADKVRLNLPNFQGERFQSAVALSSVDTSGSNGNAISGDSYVFVLGSCSEADVTTQQPGAQAALLDQVESLKRMPEIKIINEGVRLRVKVPVEISSNGDSLEVLVRRLHEVLKRVHQAGLRVAAEDQQMNTLTNRGQDTNVSLSIKGK